MSGVRPPTWPRGGWLFAPIVEAMSGARPATICAICERSLLVGEQSIRFSPDGREFVDVCPLCRDRAIQYGWVAEGGTSLPVRESQRRRGLFSRLLHRPEPVEPPVPQPVQRRLSTGEEAITEAADLFNASSHRRTVEGLTRSLGWPEVSIVQLSGVNPEIVITVCWEISWYQYRVGRDSAQPLRLAQRGHDPGELEDVFREWNAQLSDAGLIVPRGPEP
jgi:hypothetical protein